MKFVKISNSVRIYSEIEEVLKLINVQSLTLKLPQFHALYKRFKSSIQWNSSDFVIILFVYINHILNFIERLWLIESNSLMKSTHLSYAKIIINIRF